MKYQTLSDGAPAVSYFLMGVAAGSALALLFTPYSGQEARGHLKTGLASGKARVDAGAEFLKQRSEQVVKQTEELMNAGKKRVTEEARRIEMALQAGRQAYREGLSV